jgi:hypothetical protein
MMSLESEVYCMYIRAVTEINILVMLTAMPNCNKALTMCGPPHCAHYTEINGPKTLVRRGDVCIFNVQQK